MAKENQDGQEKTEDPTGKRLSDMKKKGQVPRSQELKVMVTTMIGVVAIFILGGHFARGFSAIYEDSFQLTKADTETPQAIFIHLSQAYDDTFWLLLPYFIVMILAAFFGNILIGGFVLTKEKLKFKASNMSPLKGLKRMFGTEGLVNLLKSVLKAVLVGGATTMLMMAYLADFIHLAEIDVDAAMSKMLNMIGWFAMLVTSTLIIVALIDVPYQLYKHKSESKMTKQEVKDERKQTEGSDETKRRVRQVQFQRAQQRMMQAVPDADVIITNPTHFAVALKYDEENMGAPIVIAKGADQIAMHIRDIGKHHQVTIVEAPMLARAIYFTTDIDHPIPAGLYLAVARLLAYVYQLQASPFERRNDDKVRHQWDVPDEMRFDANGKKLSD
jgi:flagellar biosynthetic protein FlhB